MKPAQHHQSSPAWNHRLVSKYDQPGPRYTSYPTAMQLSNRIDLKAVDRELAKPGTAPLSLYLHIPFCAHLCYYCACNKILTRSRGKATDYLTRLYREIARRGALVDPRREVTQMHWGGGTPTFLSSSQIHELISALHSSFTFLHSDSADYSIEIDPRTCDGDKLALLQKLGFNRISLGVQDFDPAVQKVVNRVQSFSLVRELINQGRELQFRSINLDLIYGLPLQTPHTFSQTIDQAIELLPDRLSIFNYAHMPDRFTPQQRIKTSDLPSPEMKLEILQNTVSQLHSAGYLSIGMDHFAKPSDPLSLALANGQLNRNFQGYTTHPDRDLIAMGVSSISHIGNYMVQNSPDMDSYIKAMDTDKSPVIKGFKTSIDDRIRGAVIMQLLCYFKVDKAAISEKFAIDFEQYFARELELLKGYCTDQMISLCAEEILVSANGRPLIRSICKVFDAYAPEHQPAGSFSNII